MNELIKQLADQAKNQMPKDKLEVADWIEQYNQKFAELIVRECANVAAEHDALDIYEEIREHFGVEE